ncbi:MAG: phosphorylase [Pseudomonadota bacterium]|nr:phosphorylase [Pseudomonadota bacterium]
MARETRIATGPRATVLGSGGDTARLRALLQARRGSPWRAVLSFGIAGGLDPALRPGDVVVATAILDGARRWPADLRVAKRLAGLLLGGGLPTSLGDIAGVDAPLMGSDEKAALWNDLGTEAADMESHVAAEFAAAERLPYAAIRVICDPAERALPPLVATALRPDGAVNLLGIFRSLAGNPAQLAALPGLARDASKAFRSLRRCGNLLRVGRGLPDLGELLGDVA